MRANLLLQALARDQFGSEDGFVSAIARVQPWACRCICLFSLVVSSFKAIDNSMERIKHEFFANNVCYRKANANVLKFRCVTREICKLKLKNSVCLISNRESILDFFSIPLPLDLRCLHRVLRARAPMMRALLVMWVC